MNAINRGRKNRELQREAEILEKELNKYEQGHDAYETILRDYHILEKRLQEARRDLDAEKLLGTDLENKFLILQERLCVKSRLLDECEGLAKHGFEIKNSADGWKQGGYKGQVIEKFKSIRDQSALQSEEYKIPGGTFENKRKRLRSSANVDGEHDSDRGSKLVVAGEHSPPVVEQSVKQVPNRQDPQCIPLRNVIPVESQPMTSLTEKFISSFRTCGLKTCTSTSRPGSTHAYVKNVHKPLTLIYQAYLGIKYYPPDPTIIADEQTRYQIFIQVRNDLISGRMQVDENLFVTLCGLILQSDCGDYGADRLGSNYVKQLLKLPNLNEQLEERIKIKHEDCRCRQPALVEYQLLDKVKQLSTYGQINFHIKGTRFTYRCSVDNSETYKTESPFIGNELNSPKSNYPIHVTDSVQPVAVVDEINNCKFNRYANRRSHCPKYNHARLIMNDPNELKSKNRRRSFPKTKHYFIEEDFDEDQFLQKHSSLCPTLYTDNCQSSQCRSNSVARSSAYREFHQLDTILPITTSSFKSSFHGRPASRGVPRQSHRILPRPVSRLDRYPERCSSPVTTDDSQDTIENYENHDANNLHEVEIKKHNNMNNNHIFPKISGKLVTNKDKCKVNHALEASVAQSSTLNNLPNKNKLDKETHELIQIRSNEQDMQQIACNSPRDCHMNSSR
ncbi:4.1 G protein, putative [Schistosoma mansoni]|uniref:4.1 G protein, putative n=1 Tax=Schistosoma mansoni TaxID=6183 RepID=UPI0001A63913|nr:4.1 G protein, putative [Schistosoma mansoni]|eukprot:XP_018645744.1 4.1 G protein, putative [Schistosoma mansoni]